MTGAGLRKPGHGKQGCEIGRRIPLPNSADSHTPEGRQIEYPHPAPGRGVTSSPGNRLQHSAALKETGRSVYFYLGGSND